VKFLGNVPIGDPRQPNHNKYRVSRIEAWSQPYRSKRSFRAKEEVLDAQSVVIMAEVSRSKIYSAV